MRCGVVPSLRQFLIRIRRLIGPLIIDDDRDPYRDMYDSDFVLMVCNMHVRGAAL